MERVSHTTGKVGTIMALLGDEITSADLLTNTLVAPDSHKFGGELYATHHVERVIINEGAG